MVQFQITILIFTIGMLLHQKQFAGDGRALRFNRFGGKLKRVSPHLELFLRSGVTFPLRSETHQAQNSFIFLKWKRILHEKRNYHQFNGERTPYCYS
jgi:hypothetical protein